MSFNAEALLRAQADLQGRIARCYENMKKQGIASITVGAVESRLQLLDSYWAKFSNNDDVLRSQHWELVKDQDYVTMDLVATVEEAYIQVRSTLVDLQRSTPPAADVKVPMAVASETTPPSSRSALPRIQLPTFSGLFEDWPTFRDLFKSVLGYEQSLSDVERLHHLRASVRGEAEQLVRCLPMTGENFHRAWSILTEHYENQRLLVNSFCNAFLSISKMKGETARDLRRVYHGMTAAVGSLESIGRPVFSSPDLLVQLVANLLDSRTRAKWESSLGGSAEPPSYENLRKFLAARLQALSAMTPTATDTSVAKPAVATSRTAKVHQVSKSTRSGQCPACSGNHFVMYCEIFKSKHPREKLRVVEASGLCLNCLGRHAFDTCTSIKTCATCAQRHHSTLHEACGPSQDAENSPVVAVHVANQPSGAQIGVLLATAKVRVRDDHGQFHFARALVDPASEASLVSESLVQRLRLTRLPSSSVVYGVGGARSGRIRGEAKLSVTSRLSDDSLMIEALILPKVTVYDRRSGFPSATWPHLRGLDLADPEFRQGGAVEILLGADVFAEILLEGVRNGGPGAPIAQSTTLGWILTGRSGSITEPPHPVSIHVSTVETELLNLVRSFWRQEEVPQSPKPMSPEDQACETHYSQTTLRLASGRYMVRLPTTTSDLPDFSDSYRAALRTLTGVDRRLQADPELRTQYTAFMSEYLALKHMEPARAPGGPQKTVCFLPHHGVLKPARPLPKLRVVFNGSSRLSSGDTLNRHLLVGPSLVPLLPDVLLRWRRHRFALVTDIEKMYRQVLVHPEDRRLQRILWKAPGGDVREYALTTVTYGLACAPYLAVRTLQQLADDEGPRFPLGAAALRRDSYVDDILTGADTEAETKELREQLSRLCMAGGFPLRKWAASSTTLLDGIPAEHRASQDAMGWEPSEAHSTLGIQWFPETDQFAFQIRRRPEEPITRRSVLSRTAGLFDPLGWLAPVTIRAKIFVQLTWLLQLSWDDPLGNANAQEWRNFEEELPALESIRVRRWLGSSVSDSASVELHGFADASEKAYAAVVYLRVTNPGQGATTSLVTAKTRVAPLKPVSLPRLELCAAHMLACLMSHVREVLELPDAPLHLWSDSTVALGWIRAHPARWTTFVANRVAEIQRMLPTARWHHVMSALNPADCASRGVSPRELLELTLWWNGPSFLTEVTELPQPDADAPDWDNLPEQRRTAHAVTVSPENDVLSRFSTLHRLLRVTAWILRWRQPRATRARGPLSPLELQLAQTRWIILEQSSAYSEELQATAANKPLSTRSPLLPLTPFLGDEGMLRVGGRLRRAPFADDKCHPGILPPRSRLTKLMVEAFHRRALHGGMQLTLALIRQRYWIPRGRQLVRRLIHQCTTCIRWRGATPQPLMGDLPRARVTPSRPFSRSGVDYAGPVHIRTAGGRGRKAQKAFICVFVCLVTRVIHLEVVSDYSSEAFLAAYRRFVSRRGLCRELHSDCGTTFVGADTQLRELFRASGQEAKDIVNRLASKGVQWRFNPPSAPHFGGIWEAAVKQVKHHLRRVIGEATLTYEEMATFLTEVEACLNSRPLQALSDDPDDLEALTPGHFLIGAPLVSLPEPALDQAPPTRLTRWRMLQQMRDHLWRRWAREYVTSLLPRPKWRQRQRNVEVGQLCLIRNEATPPSRWPLARVVAVCPGQDGQARVVTVRTAAGTLTRPAVKLVPLPAADGEAL